MREDDDRTCDSCYDVGSSSAAIDHRPPPKERGNVFEWNPEKEPHVVFFIAHLIFIIAPKKPSPSKSRSSIGADFYMPKHICTRESLR
jgi:hypothetical protein